MEIEYNQTAIKIWIQALAFSVTNCVIWGGKAGLGYKSLVEYLLRVHEVLGSVVSTKQEKGKNKTYSSLTFYVFMRYGKLKRFLDKDFDFVLFVIGRQWPMHLPQGFNLTSDLVTVFNTECTI